MSKLKLDGSLRSTLGYNPTDWDGFGRFGLSGKAVSEAYFGFRKYGGTGFDRFGNPGNPKSNVRFDRVKAYAYPRIVNGQVITSRELKPSHVRTGVFFSHDDYEPECPGVDDPNVDLPVRESPEQWDSSRGRVMMAGTVSVQNRRPSKKRHQKGK